MVKVRDYVVIYKVYDDEFTDWLEEQERKGIRYHKVVSVDDDLFWLENGSPAIHSEIDEYGIIADYEEDR